MRISVTSKFLLPVLLILTASAVVLGYQISSVISREAIAQAKENISAFAKIQTLRYVSSPSDFSLQDPVRTEQIFDQVLADLKLPEVLRIKVWDKNATVIYSNDKSIVGQRFSDNVEFHEAMEGESVVNIKEPNKAENISELGYEQLMEIYVPINLSGESSPVGVVETYYKLDRLNEGVKNAQLEIISIIGSIFVAITILIWALLHILVIRPLDKLELQIREVGKLPAS